MEQIFDLGQVFGRTLRIAQTRSPYALGQPTLDFRKYPRRGDCYFASLSHSRLWVAQAREDERQRYLLQLRCTSASQLLI
jgi:hypothetical protein